MTVDLVLDEHVNRVAERVLRERGCRVENARDRFGERTSDDELLERGAADGFVLVTNNAKDFEPLHGRTGHGGLPVYRDQRLPDVDPEGPARAVDEVFRQYGPQGLTGELVELDGWYGWLHG